MDGQSGRHRTRSGPGGGCAQQAQPGRPSASPEVADLPAALPGDEILGYQLLATVFAGITAIGVAYSVPLRRPR